MQFQYYLNKEGWITIAIVFFGLLVALRDGFGGKINGYKTSTWLLWDFSGLRFICSKINPGIAKDDSRNPPATFLLWIIGIYVALFGIASQRYENRIDIIENRANAIFAQLATDAYKSALDRIPIVQNMQCPIKPDILHPTSVFRSFFEYSLHEDLVELLKGTIEDWKDNLQNTELWWVNLQGADLQGTNLEEADLLGANLNKADLRWASLTEADLLQANLQGADLEGAVLYGVRFLTVEQICVAKSLCNAKLDDNLKEQVEKKCPQLLEHSKITDHPQSGWFDEAPSKGAKTQANKH